MIDSVFDVVLGANVGVSFLALAALGTVVASRLARLCDDACSCDRRYLNQAQIDEFLSRGVLVIPGALSPEQLQEAREGFHRCLQGHQVGSRICLSYVPQSHCIALQIAVDDLSTTAGNLAALSSTHGAGGILDIFYADWKLKLNENEKFVGIMQELWAYSYCSDLPYFQHGFEIFNPRRALMYIDRVCFRLPESICALLGGKKKNKIQRSLTPHLDCCPQDVTKFTSGGSVPDSLHKWRPIQAFVALTDTVERDEGGLEVCPGLHKRFTRWSNFRLASIKRFNEPPPCVGSFTPIRPIEDRDIIRQFEHVPCRAGDLVVWDYRLPHSNARKNNKNTAREVVYLGFLPDIELNRAYAKQQLIDYRHGKNPSDQWVNSDSPPAEDHGDTHLYKFSNLGRKMMTIENWNYEHL